MIKVVRNLNFEERDDEISEKKRTHKQRMFVVGYNKRTLS